MAAREGAVSRFFLGAGYVARGLGFVRQHPSLWKWIAAPAMVTALGTAALLWAIHHFGGAYVAGKVAGHGVFIGAIVWLFFWLLFVAAGVVGYIALSSIGTAPFAPFISERTEKLVTGSLAASTTQVGVLRGLGETVAALAVYLSAEAVVLLLDLFVSPLSPVWMFFGFAATGLYLAYDNLDLPLGRRGLDAAGKWAWLRAHRAETMGFGMATALFFLVPGLGLLVPAVAVTSGTLLCIDLEKQRVR